MPDKEKLAKQIDNLIVGKVIEITVVIILVGLSIPAWNAFAAKMDDINIIRLEDCKLSFQEKNENATDYLTIENNFAINKNYVIYLETNSNIDLKTEIIINNKVFNLFDFYNKEQENNIIFTLIDKSIVASRDAYSIKLINNKNQINYNYIFEEIKNF